MSDSVTADAPHHPATHAAQHTRRRLLSLSGAPLAAATVALAACATSQDQPTGSAEPATPVKLSYLHQWSQTQGHGPITDQLCARFREQFPKIQVEPTYAADYYVKLAAVLAGGDWPDVITYNLAFLPQLVRKNVLVSPETLAKGQYRYEKNDMVAAAREMATFEGKLVAMPYVLNSSGLAYNVTLYKQRGLDPTKPPATWNDLVEHSRRMTFNNGTIDVWGTQFPKGTADPISPLLAFIWQNGGDLVDEKKKVATWTSPAAVEALQFQVDLVQKHRVANYDKPGNAQAGEVGIWHIPPGNVSQLQKAVGNAFEWSTAALPKGKSQATTVGGHSLVVLKTNKFHDLAWRFVHWYTQPAQNAEYLVASTTLPPWRGSDQHTIWQQFLKEEPRFKPFSDMLSYARPTPKLSAWQDIIDVLAAARDAAGSGKKTPKDALDDAARTAAPLIEQG